MASKKKHQKNIVPMQCWQKNQAQSCHVLPLHNKTELYEITVKRHLARSSIVLHYFRLSC